MYIHVHVGQPTLSLSLSHCRYHSTEVAKSESWRCVESDPSHHHSHAQPLPLWLLSPVRQGMDYGPDNDHTVICSRTKVTLKVRHLYLPPKLYLCQDTSQIRTLSSVPLEWYRVHILLPLSSHLQWLGWCFKVGLLQSDV